MRRFVFSSVIAITLLGVLVCAGQSAMANLVSNNENVIVVHLVPIDAPQWEKKSSEQPGPAQTGGESYNHAPLSQTYANDSRYDHPQWRYDEIAWDYERRMAEMEQTWMDLQRRYQDRVYEANRWFQARSSELLGGPATRVTSEPAPPIVGIPVDELLRNPQVGVSPSEVFGENYGSRANLWGLNSRGQSSWPWGTSGQIRWDSGGVYGPPQRLTEHDPADEKEILRVIETFLKADMLKDATYYRRSVEPAPALNVSLPYLPNSTYFSVDQFVADAARRWPGRFWVDHHFEPGLVWIEASRAWIQGQYQAEIQQGAAMTHHSGWTMVSLVKSSQGWRISGFSVTGF